MNHPISSIPAIIFPENLALVEQENQYLASIKMPLYSLESRQDIAEAAADIRYKTREFAEGNVSSAYNATGLTTSERQSRMFKG